jgi:hypothetical protein
VHGALRLSPKDAVKVRQLLRQPRPCLLCGAFPPAYVGIFVPDKPELWGGKPWKVRLLGYALCSRCTTMPALTLHIEGRLQADLVGQGN